MADTLDQADILYSVEQGTSAQTVAKHLHVVFPDALTVLDMTYGSGNFWSPKHPVDVVVTGMDIDPERARDLTGDFTATELPDESYDLCVFDPPYLSDTSKTKPGVMGTRFGSFGRTADVEAAVRAGCREAWRVCRIGVLVKVQIHCHGQRLVDMEQWVRESIPSPLYGRVELLRPVKLRDRKWTRQLGVWSNSAVFLSFRKGDQRRKPRQRPVQMRAS